MKTKPKTKPPSKIQWFNDKDPEHIHPVEALKYIERRLRGSLSYQIAMDKEARIALGSWIKMIVRAQNRKAFRLHHDGSTPHSQRDCPYLHVRNCPGCGRSCDCYPKRRVKKAKPYGYGGDPLPYPDIDDD